MLKIIKRAAAFCAAAVILSGSALPAAAATRSNPGMISLYIDSHRYHSQIIDRIVQGVFSHEEVIDVSSFDINEACALEIVNLVLVKYPEIFFLDRKVPFRYSVYAGNIYTVRPNYKYSAADTDRMLGEFYTAADRYLSLVNDDMSQLEKALVLHDAIIDNSTYILDENNSSEHELIVNQKGVCEDYARVYAYLLGQLGISTEIIESDDMGHEWLKVNIGGSYYHVDITWDDPQPDRAGRVSHRFFLLSDKKIGDSAYFEPHTGFRCINKSDSITYDGDVFQSITSKCCPLNGKIYCIYTSGGESCLGSISFKEGHETASLRFSSIKELTGFYWNCGNGSHWAGNYSALLEHRGRLYYNSADEVFSYDPKTGDIESVYKLNNSDKLIFGLKIKNNKLYGLMSDTPTDNFKDKELCTLKINALAPVQKQLAKLTGSTGKKTEKSFAASASAIFSEKTGFLARFRGGLFSKYSKRQNKLHITKNSKVKAYQKS